MPKGQYL